MSEPNWHDYVEARLSAYIDGKLPEDERNQVRRHLNDCSQCQASLDTLGWTIKLVKQLPAPSLPRQFTLPVPATPARASAGSGWLRWGVAAASGLAVLVLAVFVTIEILRPQTAGSPSAAYVPQSTQATAAPNVAATVAAADTAKSAESVPATVTPQPTNVPPAVAPLPAATQAPPGPKPAQPLPTATPIRPRTSSRASTPTATMLCEYGCGGGPGNAPPGMGGGGPETTTPSIGVMQVPAQSQPVPLPLVVLSGIVGTGQLNVLASPREDSAVLGLLHRGESVDIVGRDDSAQWIAIEFHQVNQADVQGWVNAGSVILPVSIYDLPIVMLPPPGTETPTPAAITGLPQQVTPEATATASRPTEGEPTATPQSEPTLANVQPTLTEPSPTVAIARPSPTVTATLVTPIDGTRPTVTLIPSPLP